MSHCCCLVSGDSDKTVFRPNRIPVPVKIREYAAFSQNLGSKEEIFSAMVVYGFLSYENGKAVIPNKELMDKFDDMLRKEPSLGYIHRLAKESERMLRATLAGDAKMMEEILEQVKILYAGGSREDWTGRC